jgi:hypothetical protein
MSEFECGGEPKRNTKTIPARVKRLLSSLAAGALWLALASSAEAERSLTLAWNPSSSATVTGYYLYALEENALVPTRIDAGAATQVTVTGLKEGLRYGFTVTARDGVGIESVPSSELIYVVPVPLGITPPTSATGLARLRFPVAPGHWYELQASTNLKDWSSIWQTGVANTYSWVEFQDPQSLGNGSRFYRLQVH